MLDRINPIKRQINVGIDENHIEPFSVVSGDLNGNKLELTIVQDEYTVLDLTGYTVDIVFENIKKQTYSQDCIIKNATGGVVTVTLAADVISVPGTIKAELRILEGKAVKTTTGFSFVVKKSLVDVETVVPKNQLPNYKSDLQKLETETNTNLNNTKNELNTKIGTNKNRIDNIVANTGDSNSEIVDARIDNVGKVYPTLGGHIRENDKRLTKIEIGKLSTVTSTDNVINLPNSSAGQLSFSLKGRTLYKRADGTYTGIWESGCTLESVGELEGNKIEVLSTGENFINLPEIVDTTLSLSTKNFPCIIPAGKYYVNAFDENGNQIIHSNISISFNVNDEYGYGWTSFGANKVINLRKTSHSFKFYWGSEIDFKIAKISVTKEPLNSFNDYQYCVQDKIDILNTVLREWDSIDSKGVKSVGTIKNILNGTRTWFKGTSSGDWKDSGDTIAFYMNETDNLNAVSDTNIIANTLQTISRKSITNTDVEGISNVVFGKKSHLSIRILKSKLETINEAGFKKYLKENPIIVYYQSQNFAKEQLLQPLSIQSFTNGSMVIDSAIPPQITVNYPTSVTTGIQTNANGIKILNDFVKQQNVINIRLDSRITALEP